MNGDAIGDTASGNTGNFLALLRAYVVIGMVPYDELGRVYEFSPIDEVARAIMLLATTLKECTVFHPYNDHRQYLADILNGLSTARGYVSRFVDTISDFDYFSV